VTDILLTVLGLPFHIRKGRASLSIAIQPRLFDSDHRLVRAGDVTGLQELAQRAMSASFEVEFDNESGSRFTVQPQRLPTHASPSLWKMLTTADRVVEVEAKSVARFAATAQPVDVHYSRSDIFDTLQSAYGAYALGLADTKVKEAVPDIPQGAFEVRHSDMLDWFAMRQDGTRLQPAWMRPAAVPEDAFSLVDFLLFHLSNKPVRHDELGLLARSEIAVGNELDGRALELAEAGGVTLNLPAPASLNPGFSFTVALRRPEATKTAAGRVSFRSQGRNLFDFTKGNAPPQQELSFFGDASLELLCDGTSYYIRRENDPELLRLLQQLQAYPALQRMTGLTQDFVFDAGVLARLGGNKGRLRIAVKTGALGPYRVLFPWTAFALGELSGPGLTTFSPRDMGAAEKFFGGLLDIAGTRLCSVELDGPTLALIGLSQTANSPTRNKPAVVTAGSILDDTFRALPGLNDAGCELMKQDWSATFPAAIARAKELSGRRMQFVMRTAAAAAAAGDIVLGAADLVTGLRYDVETSEGWQSLCSRRIDVEGVDKSAVSVQDEGIVSRGEQTELEDENGRKAAGRTDTVFRWDTWSPVLPDPFGQKKTVEVDTIRIRRGAPEDSLPQQVFGSTYRHRARAVDVAGNSLTAKEASTLAGFEKFVSKAERYLRFSPVSEPLIALQGREEIREPREKAGNAPIELVISDAPMLHDHTRQISLYAPRVDHRAARRLGVFEHVASGRESWDILKAGAERFGAQTGQPVHVHKHIPSTHALIEDPDVEGLSIYFLPSEEARSDPRSQPFVALMTSSGAVDVPFDMGHVSPHVTLPLGAVHVRLRSGPRRFRLNGRQLVISIPPGETAEIVVTAKVKPHSLKHFGLQTWARNVAISSSRGELKAFQQAIADDSRASAALTSPLVIKLRNATRLPKVAPDIASIAPSPGGLSTGVQQVSYDVTTTVDESSTSKVIYRASWRDVEDDGFSPDWIVKANEADAFEWPVEQPLMIQAPPPAGPQARRSEHNLPDTRRRLVTLNALAVSRHSEFFEGPAGRSARPGVPNRIDVPNRELRAPFEIAYVLPLVSDAVQIDNDSASAVTAGVGMRVYYRRPALLSGEHEQLGVVIVDGSSSLDPGETSHVAEDPLDYSLPIANPSLRVEQFRNAEGPPMRVKHPGKDAQVLVIGFPIQIDAERNLLYSDIVFDHGAGHSPMVRLALVRFQPHSLPGTHISEIRFAEYGQLVDGRSLSLVYRQTRPWHAAGELDVVLTGVCPPDAKTKLPRNEVRVRATNLFSMSGRSPNLPSPGIAVPSAATLRLMPRWIDTARMLAGWEGKLHVARRYPVHGPRNASDPHETLELEVSENRIIDVDDSSTADPLATTPRDIAVFRRVIRLRTYILE
jgi:hypothetical protein